MEYVLRSSSGKRGVMDSQLMGTFPTLENAEEAAFGIPMSRTAVIFENNPDTSSRAPRRIWSREDNGKNNGKFVRIS